MKNITQSVHNKETQPIEVEGNKLLCRGLGDLEHLNKISIFKGGVRNSREI